MTTQTAGAPKLIDLVLLNQTIGQKVRSLREHRGWTQETLAISLGLIVDRPDSQGTISKLERGGRSPRIDELYALAMIFDVDTDELLGRTREEPSSPLEVARQLVRMLEDAEERADPFKDI